MPAQSPHSGGETTACQMVIWQGNFSLHNLLNLVNFDFQTIREQVL